MEVDGMWTVEVDLALSRPPKVDRMSRVTLEGVDFYYQSSW